jgi:hypothetical protein
MRLMFTMLVAVAALVLAACDAEARGRRGGGCSGGGCGQAGGGCSGGVCPLPAVPPSEAPKALPGKKADAEVSTDGSDALDEVNGWRVSRGMAPFAKCPQLTVGAHNVAKFRAAHGIAGHTPNDFAGLPAGCSASGAGSGAWPVGLVTTTGETFGACLTDSQRYTTAGAAWAIGADGRRYMQLFVR